MAYKLLQTTGELRAAHDAGIGFVWNDTWHYLHRASCWRVPQMKPYTPRGPPEGDDGSTRGSKLLWESVGEARNWIRTHRSIAQGYEPKECANCTP